MTPKMWLIVIKLAAVLALLAVAGSYVHGMGERRGLQAGETERMRITARLTSAESDVAACGATLARVNVEAARAIAEADARADAGAAAAAEAERAARESDAEAARASGALAAAKREPTCRDQLEVQLCASIPLL